MLASRHAALAAFLVPLCLWPARALADVPGGPGAPKPVRPGKSAKSDKVQFGLTAAIGTDYVNRGVSQTAGRPLLNAGAELGLKGFYTGVSAFHVDFRREGNRATNTEIDLYGGYEAELGGQAIDVGAIGYVYTPQPKAAPGVDYVEFYAKTARRFGAVTGAASIYYSPNGSGGTGTGVYTAGSVHWDVTKQWNVSALLGHQTVATGGSYTDWNLGVTRQVGKLALDLRYWDTDHHRISGDYRGRVALTATLGL